MGQGCTGIGGHISKLDSNDDEHIKCFRIGIDRGMKQSPMANHDVCSIRKKVCGEFGFKAKTGCREGLRKTIDWYYNCTKKT